MVVIRGVYRISAGIDRLLLAIGCLFLVTMALLVTADVLLRLLFNFSVVGILEVVSYYHIVFAVFLPLAYVERRGEHIRVELFVQLLPRPMQVALYVFACLVGLAFFGALTYQSGLDAVRATRGQETIMANFLFYIWPSRWALPIGFAAMCLALVSNLLNALAQGQPR